MPRKKQTQTITLFYPNQIKLADLAIDVTNNYRGKIEQLNFFLFFHILSEPFLQLYSSEPTAYYQIHSDVLRCIFRDNYKQVIAELVASEYVQVNDSYSDVLRTCKSYRIHPKRLDLSAPFAYAEQEYSHYFKRKLQTLKTLNLRVRETGEATGNSCYSNDNYQHVIVQTANVFLVPTQEALEYVRQEFKRLNNPNPAEYYFTCFNNNPLKNIGIDNFGNRLYSVITNMPKLIRACLRFISAPTERVREVDIVNSQPFFLSAVTSELITKFVPVAAEAIPVFQQYETDASLLEFKRLCQTGEFYENMQAAFSAEYGEMLSRDETKSLTYATFFGDYTLKDAINLESVKSIRARKKQQFYELFKKVFPTTYKLFKEIKAMKWEFTINNKGERKQYANNCLLAQRLESSVMFNEIVATCINNGFTELLTVHDCLLVRESEDEAITAIAVAAFSKIDLNPKFK